MSIMANWWAERGHEITLVTWISADEDFLQLESRCTKRRPRLSHLVSQFGDSHMEKRRSPESCAMPSRAQGRMSSSVSWTR